jgi:DNA polymerase I-like protein with 3'-5' exonuclease and polymerase domains
MGFDLLFLAEMEWNGVKFDKELCAKKAEETAIKLEEVSAELLGFAPTPNINLDSGHQLSCFLYGGAFELTSVESTERTVYKSGQKKGQEYDKHTYRTDTYHCGQLFVPLKGSETKLVSKVQEREYAVYQTGEDVLKQLRKPTKVHRRIIELLLLRAEYAKLMDTYYGKLPALLEKMEWGEYIHGQYNQVVAATGRLSSSAPNMQNFSGDVDQLLVSRYE